jgi:superfamily I DNA/RNA helicase
MLALEHLTPALVAALSYEDIGAADASVDTVMLFEVGYAWALRGASPIDNDLTKMLPQSLTDVARESDLYSSVDEDALAGDDSLEPGLRRRIDALFGGFAQKRIVDGLGDLLTHLALWGEEGADVGGNVVTLSTYHSAKGLEFERVICQNVDSGSFPPFFADTQEDEREARRLLYVGMTRAEQRLVLTAAAENHRGFGQDWTTYLRSAPRRLFAPL